MSAPQNKEVILLREDHVQMNNLKNQVERLRSSEVNAKTSEDKVAELQRVIEALQAELKTERTGRQAAVEEKDNIKKEKDMVSEDLT